MVVFGENIQIYFYLIKNLTIDDVSSLFLLLLKSLALGYGLVISHSEFLCDFLDELKSLGWM